MRGVFLSAHSIFVAAVAGLFPSHTVCCSHARPAGNEPGAAQWHRAELQGAEMVPHFHSLWGEHPSRESSAAAQEHASTQRETTHTDLPSAKPIAFYHPSAVESNMLLWKKTGFRVCTQAQKERNREQNNRNKVRSESSRSLLRECRCPHSPPPPLPVPLAGSDPAQSTAAPPSDGSRRGPHFP